MYAHEQDPGRRDVTTRSARRNPVEGSAPGLLALQRLVGNAAVAGLVQRTAVDRALGSSGAPMAGHVRADMEKRLGADFSDVRVHTGSEAASAAHSVQARAFTAGSHIVFGRGHYDTTSAVGKHVLAHELAHVVQQRTGPVSGTDTGDGMKVSDPGDPDERAAEADATRAMRGDPAPERDARTAGPNSGGPDVLQRAVGAELEENHWRVKDEAGKPVPKGTALVHRPYFQLQAEFGGAEQSNIEMVTNPPGVVNRNEWDKMLKGMIALKKELLKQRRQFSAGVLKGGVDEYQLLPAGIFSPSVQVTAGVPLAAMHQLFTELEGLGVKITPRGDVPQQRRPEGEAQRLGPVVEPSKDLLGFITLLDSYLEQGAVDARRTFPKGVFPVLARTDFAAMFGMLPEAERNAIAADVDAWVRLVAERPELKDPLEEDRLLNQWFDDPMDDSRAMEITTTRTEWLTEMVPRDGRPGRDLLTAHGKLGPDDAGLTDREKAERLAAEVRQDVNPKRRDGIPKIGEGVGQRPSTEPIPIPEEEHELRKLIDELRELYAGMGALKTRTAQVKYTGARSMTPAAIVEIRQTGAGKWEHQLETVYQAVERAISTGGTYTNELTDEQQRLRRSGEQERKAATKSLAHRIKIRVKALLQAARPDKAGKRPAGRNG